MSEILDVDLLAFEQGDAGRRRSVVDGVMRSLATGFVYTSHDLSEQMLDETYAALADFFGRSRDEKLTAVAEGTYGQRGYTGLLVETAASSDVPDWKEMLNWGRAAPEGHPLGRHYPNSYHPPVFPEDLVPGISDLLMTFHDSMFELQRRFLRIIAVGLGCHESVFDSMIAHGSTLTRAIRYPPMTEAPGGGDEGHVWAGAHGDINLITALPRATSKGLQVETESGWIDARPPEGHVIINTGIMLERLSNARIPIGVHRVVADPDDPGERYSVVQFCHPEPWTILAPFSSCVDEAHPQRFAPISAGDLLDQVLWEINLVEDGRRVED